MVLFRVYHPVCCWARFETDSDIWARGDIRVSHPLQVQHPFPNLTGLTPTSGIESSLDSSGCGLRWQSTISFVNGLP
jgi:hypothetical protein